MTKVFKVAEHCFSLSLPDSSELWGLLGQYDPFVCDGVSDTLFSLSLTESAPDVETELVLDPETVEGETLVRLFRAGDGWMVESTPDKSIPIVSRLWTNSDWTEGKLQLVRPAAKQMALFAVNNALMIMYAFVTAPLGTLEMHASVIRCEGRAFLFLARSGTGKSTHSRMWLENIPGSELLNDDNPVVRAYPDGRVICYGSPWSGKTPCYRNIEAPVGAFVRIRRCPENKIQKLDIFNAYAMLYSSSSGFKADRKMADGLHETIEAIVTDTPCYVLDCRPDAEAARVCSDAVLWNR